MKKLKLIFIVIFVSCLLSVSAGPLHADTAAKILIIPFALDSKTPNVEMGIKVAAMIQELLEKEGAAVEYLSDMKISTADWTHDQFSKLGLQKGADYLLTGSLFVAGESISIDSTLVNTFDENESQSIFAQAPRFENLFAAVSKVSKEITSVMFQKNFITSIAVVGNKRIEKDAILRNINSSAGDILKSQNISNDVKKIFSMGYFDDVVVKKQPNEKGVTLIYEVVEKATVRRIKFTKNVVFEDEELQDVVNTRTGSILNVYKIKDDINRLRLMYTEKNYHNIAIDYEILPLENAQADIVFNFNEGEKVRVEKISFEGNQYFSEKKIKKQIETKEKGFWSFFTSSGDLNEIEVKNDVVRIESLYKNNGFIDAKVSDPIIDIGKKSISIHFKIYEGAQYKIKTIDITGDMIQPKQELLEMVQSKPNELYNRELVRKDIQAVSENYLNQGYANVHISPRIRKDDKSDMMNVTLDIKKGELVYFDRIKIKGNSKTRDKVIRREIMIAEQGRYSKEKIQNSFKNLNRLDYFENIQVNPIATDEENKRDLEVVVVEKQTGAFSVGGGFSSEKSGFVTVSLKEKNLFGRGYTGTISAEVSGEEVLYNLSFYDPYIFDTNISGGFNLYRQEVEYDFYDKDSTGLGLNIGYKLYDYTRIGARYNLEDYTISNVVPASTNATAGDFLSSSITPFIRYDSRNALFMPTEGSKHELSVEYSGGLMGGDIDFIKYLASTSVYFPLFWKFTGLIHGEAGYIDDQTNNSINIDHEKFYMGGMDSVRGFGDTDINGQRSGNTKQIGGEKYVQMNVEVSFPLLEEYKMSGLFFYDRGDVYRDSEDIDFADQYSSVGLGVRWNSPVGPIKVDYGWVVEGKSVKDSGSGRVHFSVGASF